MFYIQYFIGVIFWLPRTQQHSEEANPSLKEYKHRTEHTAYYYAATRLPHTTTTPLLSLSSLSAQPTFSVKVSPIQKGAPQFGQPYLYTNATHSVIEIGAHRQVVRAPARGYGVSSLLFFASLLGLCAATNATGYIRA